MRATPLERKIFDLTGPLAQELSLEVFWVRIVGEAGSKNVQIMAQDPKTKRLGVDQCAALSRAISAVMDVEDPIDGAYRLEVSSPGIDRFLIKLEHFDDYQGCEVKIETDVPAENGQKRFKGVIKERKENLISLETDQGIAELPYDSISKAKLVLTDALIKATADI